MAHEEENQSVNQNQECREPRRQSTKSHGTRTKFWRETVEGVEANGRD